MQFAVTMGSLACSRHAPKCLGIAACPFIPHVLITESKGNQQYIARSRLACRTNLSPRVFAAYAQAARIGKPLSVSVSLHQCDVMVTHILMLDPFAS